MTNNFEDIHFKNVIFNSLSRNKLTQLMADGLINENEWYVTNDGLNEPVGGLDILDIGTSPFIDETLGLRRRLNGTWVELTDDTRKFYERVLRAVTLDPTLVCTNAEFETAVNTDGYCHKFVADITNHRIRLPLYTEPNLFMQIATGIETTFNLDKNIFLKTRNQLGESTYSTTPLTENWVAGGTTGTRAHYPNYYDLLLSIYNGETSVNGITVKATGDATITRLDHVLDTTNETFTLPTLDGSENMIPTNLTRDRINITSQVTANGAQITAPYNGWLVLSCTYEPEKTIDLYNRTTGMDSMYNSASAGGTHYTTNIWAYKDNIVECWYSSTLPIRVCYFYVATKPGTLYFFLGEYVS